MTQLAIGFAIMWLVTQIRSTKIEAKGIIGIALMLFICYGIGSIVMLLIGKI